MKSPFVVHMMTSCIVMSICSTILPGGAEAVSTEDERYVAVQLAFLQEDFERVATLVESFPLEEGRQPPTPMQVRMGLWYALSLDRLQRAAEAFRELDRLKARVLASPEEADRNRLGSELLFWEGEISRRAYEWVRARRAYHQLLTQFPRSIWRAQAQVGLGLVLFQQQAYDAAGEQAREVARGPIESPVVRDAMLVEGLCHLKLRRFDEAQRLFHELLAQPLAHDLRLQVTLYESEALAGLGRMDDALAAYQRVMTEGPGSSWARLARFGLGWMLFQQGRCRESLEAFKEYVGSLPPAASQRADLPWRGGVDPTQTAGGSTNRGVGLHETFAQLWLAQGRCLMELGDEHAALAHFETLEHLFPGHPRAVEAALSHSEFLERHQRLAEARAVIERLPRRSLSAIQQHHVALRLGSLDVSEGQAEAARARFLSVKDAQETELRQAAFNGLGDAALFLGHDQEAEDWYRQAEAIDPGCPAGAYASYQQGRLWLKAGRRGEAMERFRALTTHPLRPQDHSLMLNARLALALSYLVSDEPDTARDELRRAVQEAPDSRQAARVDYYLALLALHEGQLDEAKRLCREVGQRAAGSDEAFEAQLLLADLSAGERSFEAALGHLQPLIDSFDRLPIARRGALAVRLGHLARLAGAYAIAIRWYETAWSLVPSQQGELDYRIASCYEEGGDRVAAANRYRAIRQPPWSIRGRLAAAKLMERSAQWHEAMRLYQSVVQQSVPEAKIAQERLAALSALEQASPDFQIDDTD